MIRWPTTNCRRSKGLSSSSGMLSQGICCSAGIRLDGLLAARWARERSFASRGLAFGFALAFFVGISLCTSVI